MNSERARLKAWRFAPAAALAFALLGACAEAEAGITCQFTTSAMAFGNYDPSTSGASDGNGSVDVNCTHDNSGSTNSVTVTLSINSGSYGTVAARKMQKSAGQQLNYNLYRDTARSQIWGTGGSYLTGTISITNITKNHSKTGKFTIYGRIPALQNAQAGTYNDNVSITISP